MIHHSSQAGAVDDGILLEPYAMSILHYWRRARDDVDATLLEPWRMTMPMVNCLGPVGAESNSPLSSIVRWYINEAEFEP